METEKPRDLKKRAPPKTIYKEEEKRLFGVEEEEEEEEGQAKAMEYWSIYYISRVGGCGLAFSM